MDVLNEKTVTTRVEHRCSCCLRKFPKGTRMYMQTNVFDGDIGTWKQCMTCVELTSKFGDKFRDEDYGWISEGAVAEYLEKGQTPEQLLESLTVE